MTTSKGETVKLQCVILGRDTRVMWDDLLSVPKYLQRIRKMQSTKPHGRCSPSIRRDASVVMYQVKNWHYSVVYEENYPTEAMMKV